MNKKQDLEISNKIIEEYAGESFPSDIAKLYAHHSRLQAKKEGLKSWNYLHDNYANILEKFIKNFKDSEDSALFRLLEKIFNEWQKITQETSQEKFIEWIENTRPINENNEAVNALDNLDDFLLSVIKEIDNISKEDALEDKILKILGNTYANYVNNSD